MRRESRSPIRSVLAGALWVALAAGDLHAVEPVRVYGSLGGRVMDSAGIPQMGAAVLLYNRFDRLVGRVVTNERGAFAFDTLRGDLYSIRVTLASFVPALKRNVSVQPGMRSYLSINLASVLSSIELVYTAPGQGAIMSEEWKWALRSANATRPVLRFGASGIDISDPEQKIRRQADGMFSDTRGVVKLSSGEGGPLTSAGNQADLGTAFALATSLFGNNQVAVSGNLGYASHTGTPTAGFRTSFSRDVSGSSPQVNVTMRQVFLPARIGNALLAGGNGEVPALQTLAVSFVDRRQLTDDLALEFGSSLESVSFLDRLNYLSPFARLRWGSTKEGAVEVAYSSGAPATELLSTGDVSEADLQHQLTTLSIFPRVSLRGGRAQVQRSQNFELGYRRAVGSRTYSASAWRESTSNAAFNAAVPVDYFGPGELLPDLATKTSVFNAGRFQRMGYQASATQQIGESVNATVAYGYAGALQAGPQAEPAANASVVRGLLHRTNRHSVTGRVAGATPGSGTRYVASYQITDYRSLQPVHLSLTQRATIEPGLNLYLRQPLPGAGMVPGRLEASLEMRNVLAQGYLSIATPGGQRVVLVQSPRAVRGGVSLIF